MEVDKVILSPAPLSSVYNFIILLITHEPELINSLNSELWVMNKNTKQVYTCLKSYDDYCQEIINSE